MTLPRALPRCPDAATLGEFAVFLKNAGTMGGATVKSYVSRLPTALAIHFDLPLGAKRCVIPPVVKNILRNVAKSVPAVHRVQRGVASADVIVQVQQSRDADVMVSSAIVVQYLLGARGINLYSTAASRAVGEERVRPLQWRDVKWVQATPSQPPAWEVDMRQEKTSTACQGTFARKYVTRSPNPNLFPCGLRAMNAALAARNSRRPHDLVFPEVTDTKVNQLLKQHAPRGVLLTTHSVRAGAATDLSDENIPAHVRRMIGNWMSDSMADRYARQTPRHTTRNHELVIAAMRRAVSANKQVSPTQTRVHHQPDQVQMSSASRSDARLSPVAATPTRQSRVWSTVSGAIRIPHQGVPRVLMFACVSKGVFWGYFYTRHTHVRTAFVTNTSTGRKTDHEPYKLDEADELEWFWANSTALECPQPGSDLHEDLQWVKERAERGVYQKLRLKVAPPVTRATARSGGSGGGGLGER